jgi:hypothetical protein
MRSRELEKGLAFDARGVLSKINVRARVLT